MKLFLLVAITMCAFAGNSVLGRIGIATYGMDPFVFSFVRIAAGAVMLALLVLWSGKRPPITKKRFWGALALAGYVFSFSWAYITLDAGLGALILFGVLQVAMFAFAVFRGQDIPTMRWIGAGAALVGLAILLWPAGQDAVHVPGAAAMVFSGLAWATYTLLGQGESDALAASAGNFLLCVPFVALGLIFANGAPNLPGSLAAILSGAVTSGLGYALWYRVLPSLPTTVAAVAQLSVPVIAVAVGAIVLDEMITDRLLISGILVLGGIAISLTRRSA